MHHTRDPQFIFNFKFKIHITKLYIKFINNNNKNNKKIVGEYGFVQPTTTIL